MAGHAQQCVETYLALTKQTLKDLDKVITPCLDDHRIAPEDFITRGVLHDSAAKIVMKILYVALVSRPDLYWSVNSLARGYQVDQSLR